MAKSPSKHKPWWSAKTPKPWAQSSSIVRLKGASQPMQKIGSGMRKDVYFGKVFFSQGGRVVKKPVAIKRFQMPISDVHAQEYLRVIDYLRVHRFPIPKSTMHKLSEAQAHALGPPFAANEWVAIQQFFGSSGIPRLVDRGKEHARLSAKGGKYPYSFMGENQALFSSSRSERNSAVKLLARLAKLGISPSFDIIAPIRGGRKKGVIPFDLDIIVENSLERKGKIPDEREIALGLIDSINHLSRDDAERERLFGNCLNELGNSGVAKLMNLMKIFINGNILYELEEMDERMPSPT